MMSTLELNYCVLGVDLYFACLFKLVVISSNNVKMFTLLSYLVDFHWARDPYHVLTFEGKIWRTNDYH